MENVKKLAGDLGAGLKSSGKTASSPPKPASAKPSSDPAVQRKRLKIEEVEADSEDEEVMNLTIRARKIFSVILAKVEVNGKF